MVAATSGECWEGLIQPTLNNWKILRGIAL